MIDTLKIYCEIDKNTYDKIYNSSIIKMSVDNKSKNTLYEIVNDSLEGSYSSSLSVRVGCGTKYGFVDLGYYIEIEGSYHKIIKGYNSHNGFYDLEFISRNLIIIVDEYYNIDLPDFKKWFLQRVDIAICYDLKEQDFVKSYINSLSRCNYPRRKVKFFYDESVYISGTSTTLKIYNKYLEFKKHDLKKFVNTSFDLITYFNNIKGFVRFECEIKKKMLKSVINKKNINICDLNYDILRNIWREEFMKLLKFVDNDLEIVRYREEVKDRLLQFYKPAKAMRLFSFYCSIQLNGIEDIKKDFDDSTYYRNITDLKNVSIDFSQTYKVEEVDNMFYFNPFESQEVM